MRSRVIVPAPQPVSPTRTINVLSPECLGPEILPAASASWASGAFTANLIIFVPLIVAQPLVVSQFFWQNGATVAGNTDVGIYNSDGSSKLASSGSTANAGTSAIQIVNITNIVLPANTRLWLALSSDSSVQTYLRNATAARSWDYMGIQQQAAGWSSGLPASATFAAPAVAYLPFCGFTGSSVI